MNLKLYPEFVCAVAKSGSNAQQSAKAAPANCCLAAMLSVREEVGGCAILVGEQEAVRKT